MSAGNNIEKFRIDKWLCAARFFKTRHLAADAVKCGKVHINEVRVKPAKAIVVGDMLTINIGQKQYVVEVLALSNRRDPASEAQRLYRETDANRQRLEVIAAQLKAQPQPFFFKGMADQARSAGDRAIQEGAVMWIRQPAYRDVVANPICVWSGCHFDPSNNISRRMLSAGLD